MADPRNLPHKLARIAGLQALRALESKTRLADARLQSDEARERLEVEQRRIDERVREMDTCVSGETIDLAALGIGRAVLATLERGRERAQVEADDGAAREGECRAEWRRETGLTERADELQRKFARRAAQKREDEAAMEVTQLRFARAWRNGA